jgi:hypothetical protein
MRHNQPTPCLSTAQPVVGPVPPPDDESDVTRIGTAPCARLSLLPTSHSLLPAR